MSNTHGNGNKKPAAVQREAVMASKETDAMVNVVTTKIGIYGWRKWCVYFTLLFVLTLTIINIGLIVFVFRVMNLDKDSAGPLHFTNNNLLVRGRAEFLNGIIASNITGFDNATLLVESDQQIILRSYEDGTSSMRSALVLDGITVNLEAESLALQFDNRTYFQTSAAETRISSNDIVIESDTGLRVNGAVQVPTLSNLYTDGAGLTIQSLGQNLNVEATLDVTVESVTNHVSVNGFQGVNVESTNGDITFSAANLQLPNLPSDGSSGVQQLCQCGVSWKLYRVSASSTCAASAAALCPQHSEVGRSSRCGKLND